MDPMKVKGITAWIYRSTHYPAKQDVNLLRNVEEVTVIGTRDDNLRGRGEFVPLRGGVFEPSEKAPPVVLVYRTVGGDKIVHAEPVILPDKIKGHRPMSGGAFIESSDGRFTEAARIYGAVNLHDRYEGL